MKKASDILNGTQEEVESSLDDIQFVTVQNLDAEDSVLSGSIESSTDTPEDDDAFLDLGLDEKALSREIARDVDQLDVYKKRDPLDFYSHEDEDKEDINSLITRYASSNADVSKQDADLMNKIAGTQTNRLRIFLTAHTQKMVRGVSKYQKIMEHLESEIFDVDKIKAMSQYEKMMLYKLVRSSKIEDLDRIEAIITNGKLKPATINIGDEDSLSQNLANKSPREREKIRNQLESLIKTLETDGSDE